MLRKARTAAIVLCAALMAAPTIWLAIETDSHFHVLWLLPVVILARLALSPEIEMRLQERREV
jgi:hypothetical protein